jgi:hypothetical protein
MCHPCISPHGNLHFGHMVLNDFATWWNFMSCLWARWISGHVNNTFYNGSMCY